MPYATQSDLEKHLSPDKLRELSDRSTPPAGVIDVAIIAKALDDASAEIDSYLRVRYATPVTPTLPELVQACCKLATYQLHAPGGAYPEGVAADRAQTIAWLRDVASGKALLDAATPATPASQSGSHVSQPARLFTREGLGSF